nr:hypothetical protein [uncultured Campylobacter sp.]
MDKVRFEESKKPLNEGHQNLKQKLRKGASADIFDDADLNDATDRSSLNLNDINLSSKSFKNANFNQTYPKLQPDHLCGANFRDTNLNSKDEVKFQNLNPGGVSSRGAKTRDYDKEPLVIKDYMPIVNIIAIVALLCFAMFINLVFNIPYDRKVANILLTVPLVARVLKGFSQHYGRKFIFLNSSIKCIKSGEQLVMKFDDILYFKKTFALVYESETHKYTETERIIGKTCLAIYVLAYIYGAIFDDSMIVFIMLFCCMGAVIFLFIPQMIFHLFKGGLFSCRFVDALIIDALYNKFFIFIPTNKEYNELKKYMKLKFNKDLDAPNYLLRVKNF